MALARWGVEREQSICRDEAAGAEAIVLTVDAPGLGTRERDARNKFSLRQGLAIENLLGIKGLASCIGCVYERDGAPVIPLPHPSGASAWTSMNRDLTDRAAGLVREQVARFQG